MNKINFKRSMEIITTVNILFDKLAIDIVETQIFIENENRFILTISYLLKMT